LNRLAGFSFDLPNVQLTAAHPRPHLIEIQIVRRQPHEKFTVDLETQRADRFARPRLMTADKQQPFSSAMSVQHDLFPDDARDLRARGLKIHKHYRLAMKITDVRVPHDRNAHRLRRLACA
jgi:hypothetical protein